MVEIKIESDKAIFEMQNWDKLWSLRSRLEIPLAHITGVQVNPNAKLGWFQGLKLAGTDLPNIFRAGSFYQKGNLVFWDVHHPEKAIVINLLHERYGKLIIEVADPNAAVTLIKEAIS